MIADCEFPHVLELLGTRSKPHSTTPKTVTQKPQARKNHGYEKTTGTKKPQARKNHGYEKTTGDREVTRGIFIVS